MKGNQEENLFIKESAKKKNSCAVNIKERKIATD